MNYQEVLAAARGEMGPYCKVCLVCKGLAVKIRFPVLAQRELVRASFATIRNGRKSA